jgi:cell division protein ZapE
MKLDSQQILVKNELDKLASSLEEQVSKGILKKIISPKHNSLKSLYIHGGVGRGKTMLMKNFFDSLKKTPKIYIHFNSFMRAIHEALRDIRNEKKKYKDELIEAVRRVVKDKKLICFDEFQVTDIADAMLLARIFSFLFSHRVVAVFTSNIEPLKLYKNGLQREVFLEFVKNILLKNCLTLHLNSSTDYRAKLRKGLVKRYFISNKKNREEVKNIITDLTEGKKPKATKIKVWGREIKIKKTFGKIAVTSFEELCCQTFAAADYQEICKNFDLIFLLKLPVLTAENVNEMRRFMLFIDEVYEKKVALIVLARASIDKLCSAEVFKRTASRLKEIGSDGYWR